MWSLMHLIGIKHTQHVHSWLLETSQENYTGMLLHAGFANADFAGRGVLGTVKIKPTDTHV